VTVEQVAKDIGVHLMTLFKWLRQAEADEGAKGAGPGVSCGESVEQREARRRSKLLNRRTRYCAAGAAYLSQAHLPANALPARE
jgi:transposase-like protein